MQNFHLVDLRITEREREGERDSKHFDRIITTTIIIILIITNVKLTENRDHCNKKKSFLFAVVVVVVVFQFSGFKNRQHKISHQNLYIQIERERVMILIVFDSGFHTLSLFLDSLFLWILDSGVYGIILDEKRERERERKTEENNDLSHDVLIRFFFWLNS